MPGHPNVSSNIVRTADDVQPSEIIECIYGACWRADEAVSCGQLSIPQECLDEHQVILEVVSVPDLVNASSYERSREVRPRGLTSCVPFGGEVHSHEMRVVAESEPYFGHRLSEV